MIKSVRLATIKDAEELSRLNQAFNGSARRIQSEIIQSMERSNELIAVAILNEKIVGFACAQSYESFCYRELQGEITEMYIEKTARRLGFATSLIKLLENNLLDRGVREIKILTNRTNSAAIKTYEKCNYVQDEVILFEKEF
ncbi:GNAT family N-acetyltransferase [Metabacillus sp. FJAT-53654]|uniref:GNAT family N-acetyltransferase n=1 Tax=Metabacillus rhizosphaerae TaxID=3117747 RepID=A0ABZ2MP74_9BACI